MKRLIRNNKGVSTIVASALLVALVVILGVALASTVPQASTVDKPTQLQLQGTASFSANELRLTHIGGDTVNTQVIKLYTYVTQGQYAGQRYQVIINDNLDTDSTNEAPAIKTHPHPVHYDSSMFQNVVGGEFGPGDTLVLNLDYCFEYGNWGMVQVPVGYQFVVEIQYDGQPVTATTITMQS